MARKKTGEAIGPRGRSASGRRSLRRFIQQAQKRGDLEQWRRGRAVLGYIEGGRVVELAEAAGVTRGSVNRWLQAYEALGLQGLIPGKAPGPAARLQQAQQDELAALIDAGPQAAGYQSGVWTGPMIGDLIAQRFGVRYHRMADSVDCGERELRRILRCCGGAEQEPQREKQQARNK